MTIFDWIQTVAGFILAIFYLQNIPAVWREKDTKPISFKGWLWLLIGLGGMLANSIHIYFTFHTWSYMLAEILNFGLCLVYVVEVAIIRNKYEGIKVFSKEFLK